MSPGLGEILDRNNRFPRVSGDEPFQRRARTSPGKFSPRERG